MNRLYQNIIYTGIIVVVIGFFWILSPNIKLETQAMFLPNNNEVYPAIDDFQAVNFYTSGSNNIINKNQFIGVLNVATHYVNKKDISAACNKNLKKAKEVAAEYGGLNMIGNCVVWHDNPSNIAKFYAYIYR